MAAMGAADSGSASSSSGAEAERLPVPSKNPLPLSASQEAQVRELYYARVRRKCKDEIKAFADCARGRTFSVAWACRNLHMAMNNCMKAHATPEEQDAAREEWFATRLQRLKERERKAKRAAEQEAFFREWWGLPQKEREEIEKKLEKFKHVEERVAVVRKKTPGEERR